MVDFEHHKLPTTAMLIVFFANSFLQRDGHGHGHVHRLEIRIMYGNRRLFLTSV